jgi:hypothetical protein
VCRYCGTVRGSAATSRPADVHADGVAARQLTEAIGDVPGGRMLILGGAFDALAEEARRRGLEVDRQEEPESYGAIVVVHALEVAANVAHTIERCAGLLEDDGVLAVVSFEPSKRVDEPFRQLVPASTLRELVAARGLVVSADVPFGGERAIIAHKTDVVRPTEPIASYRGGDVTVHAVLPSYNAAATLPRVADELPSGILDRALVVDDLSGDATAAVAHDEGFDLLSHRANRGYGGSQKTGYARALLDGADIVVMIHGDNQYDPGLVATMIQPIREEKADMVIGSRLLGRGALAGGMPRWKWIGNRFLTEVENLAFGRRLSEYHSGYRAYSADLLRSIAFLRASDDFVFDQEIVAQAVARRARIAEIPIPTRYFPEASSVDFKTSVVYGLRTLGVTLRYLLHRLGLRWMLLSPPAAEFRPVERMPVHDRST